VVGDVGTHSLEGLTASRHPVDTGIVLPPLAKRTAALLFATIFAVVAASARADDQPPNTFKGHGLTFSYPGSWIEIPATFETQIGTPLWTESIGPTPAVTPPAPADPAQPQPSPTPQPTATHLALVTLAAYHISVAITPRNIARFKRNIAARVAQIAAQTHGQVESGPIRVNLARLPGYRFRLTVQLTDGTTIQTRIVFVFRKKTEYFLNCEYPQNDPSAAEIESGCDQVTQSFRLGS
jgi:hypothetical protein